VQVYGHFSKPRLRLEAPRGGRPMPVQRRNVYMDGSGFVSCDVYRRDHLPAGVSLPGPLVVEEASSTTIVGRSDTLAVDDDGNLVVTVGA
jgi:N-methylhydantoinase A